MYSFHNHSIHLLLISEKKTGKPFIYCIGLPVFNILLDIQQIDKLLFCQERGNQPRRPGRSPWIAQPSAYIVVASQHLPAPAFIGKDTPQLSLYLRYRHRVGHQLTHHLAPCGPAIRLTSEMYFTFNICRFRKAMTRPMGVW